jgi:hypothetical protein
MAEEIKSKTGKKGRESYTHAKADARKEKKRLEADKRQDKHDSLTLKEKIAKATKRGGSVRELKRLTELLNRKPEPKAPVVEVTAPKAATKPAKGTKRVSTYRRKTANN